MNTLLTIDTSGNYCSVGLLYKEKLITRRLQGFKSHAEVILDFVNELLTEANICLSQLDAIVFAKGPGSFTGLRISSCIAQGLAASHNIGIIGISTLQAFAQQAYRKFGEDNIWVINDARMGEVYHGQYRVNANGVMACICTETVEPLAAIKQLSHECKYVGSVFEITADDELPEQILKNKLILEAYCSQPQDLISIAQFQTPLSAKFALPSYIRNNVAHKKREPHG